MRLGTSQKNDIHQQSDYLLGDEVSSQTSTEDWESSLAGLIEESSGLLLEVKERKWMGLARNRLI